MTWQSKTRRRKSSSTGGLRRQLWIEPLEQRLLLAGDTYLVNFQFASSPTPNRYLIWRLMRTTSCGCDFATTPAP